MMKRILLLIACLLAVRSAAAWGQKGHDVTAYIAECHLTPEAAERIDKVLGGHSPVYYANWLDNASHTPEYAYTKTWHYRNIDAGETSEDGLFSLELVNCLGSCALAPVMVVDGTYYGKVTLEKLPGILEQYREVDHG